MNPAPPSDRRDVTEAAGGSAAISPGPGYDRRYFERAYFDDHPGKRRSHAEVVRRLRAAGLSSGHVLDIGAGAGYLMRALEEGGYQASGLDHADEALLIARARAEAEHRTIDVRLGDVCERIPWPDDSFDAVIMHDVIEHLPDDLAAVNEVKRVLRPGGYALISTMNAGGLLARVLGSRWAFYDDPTHLRPYDLPALVALFGYQGFRVRVWQTYFDLNKAGETTPAFGPLRRLGCVLPGFGLGETALLVVQRPYLETPAWNAKRS
ncbi:MAG: class I SAM-dependent methyltransferase [Planctomycetota bacterium]